MIFGIWKNFLGNTKKTKNFIPQILVIDDEESCISSLELMLHEFSIKITGITNSEKLNKWLEDHKLDEIDLVLLDMIMPDIDGLEVLKKIKNFQVPAIIQTGITENEIIESALRIGVAGYITKPYVKDDILALLSKYIKLEKKAKAIV